MNDGPSMTLDSYLGQLVGESQNWIDKRSGESVDGILASIDGVRGIVDALKAERDALRALVNENNAVCACGCPPDAHESLGEDGESCEDESHQCIRVCYSVRSMFDSLRAQLATAQRVPEDAELDALIANETSGCPGWPREMVHAITALRRQLAEARVQRDGACALADRITNQRRERCPTCFGDVGAE